MSSLSVYDKCSQKYKCDYVIWIYWSISQQLYGCKVITQPHPEKPKDLVDNHSRIKNGLDRF